jgi:hypothetical protein
MIRRIPVPLPIQSGEADVRPWSMQALVNGYAEAAEGGAVTPARIVRAGGLTLTADTGVNYGVRGMGALKGVLYVVVNDTLYSVTKAGVATAIAGDGISGGQLPVSIAENRMQLCIVTADGDGYVYEPDGAGTVDKISTTEPDWLPATSVVYFDDRGVFIRKDSEEYFLSALADFADIDALDFASAEKRPDELVAVLSDHGELWLFGETTIEVWFNAGLPDFPFARIDGGVIERGCAARAGVAKQDNTVFWIGDDRTIYRANGYQPQRISTHAIEAELEAMVTVADCQAFTWTENGHKFVSFLFPEGGKCFVFDAATTKWHERRSGVGEASMAWRCGAVLEVYGGVYFGDRLTGKVYRLNREAYDEAGEAMEWSVTTLPIYNGEQRLFYAGLDAHFDMGRGLLSGQGSDPQVMLTYSNDGGYTFGTELTRSLGARGDYKARVRWNRLGMARDRVFRLRVTDPVPLTLMDLQADIEVGAA